MTFQSSIWTLLYLFFFELLLVLPNYIWGIRDCFLRVSREQASISGWGDGTQYVTIACILWYKLSVSVYHPSLMALHQALYLRHPVPESSFPDFLGNSLGRALGPTRHHWLHPMAGKGSFADRLHPLRPIVSGGKLWPLTLFESFPWLFLQLILPLCSFSSTPDPPSTTRVFLPDLVKPFSLVPTKCHFPHLLT